MKYKVVLIASERRIMYHGTTSLNEQSIREKGLIVNGSHPSVGMRTGEDKKPLGGVYLANKARATEYANSQVKTWGGKPLLISVVIKPDKYCVFDDDITLKVLEDIKKSIKNEKSIQDIVSQLFKFIYKISSELLYSLISDKEFTFIEQIVNSKIKSNEDIDKVSRIFGRLVPYIKPTRMLQYNIWNKLRYLHNIGFTGKTRIVDIKVLE